MGREVPIVDDADGTGGGGIVGLKCGEGKEVGGASWGSGGAPATPETIVTVNNLLLS